MNIGIIGSMQFTDSMLEIKKELEALGHSAFITDLHTTLIGKSEEDIEAIKLHQKYHQDAICEFWKKMQDGDAVLVLNYDKNGVKHYIGANTFLEMGFAHVLNQKIFLLNPVPDLEYFTSEIEAMRPIILHGDLSLIK